MKRMLAAMLAALMLVTFLPLASPPAQACTGFGIRCRATYAYAGEKIQWWVYPVEGTEPFEYAFDLYKDGNRIYLGNYNSKFYRFFLLSSPGKYAVYVSVRGKNHTVSKFSDEITVKANPNRITKVEPLGATSLRITWNKVPGVAVEYYLYRSTDMKTWEMVKKTSATSFSNTYLKAGTRYFYKVEYQRPGQYNDMIEGTSSNVASGVPMAKTRITSITSPSARRIRMTWARAAGASGYQVAMATRANGSYKSVRIVTGGTTVTFSGVKSGSTLYFKVRPYRRVYTTTYWGQYSAYRAVKVK